MKRRARIVGEGKPWGDKKKFHLRPAEKVLLETSQELLASVAPSFDSEVESDPLFWDSRWFEEFSFRIIAAEWAGDPFLEGKNNWESLVRKKRIRKVTIPFFMALAATAGLWNPLLNNVEQAKTAALLLACILSAIGLILGLFWLGGLSSLTFLFGFEYVSDAEKYLKRWGIIRT